MLLCRHRYLGFDWRVTTGDLGVLGDLALLLSARHLIMLEGVAGIYPLAVAGRQVLSTAAVVLPFEW
jgi:hypothetical protein